MTGLLTGLLLVDLSLALSGSHATMTLGDLDARMLQLTAKDL